MNRFTLIILALFFQMTAFAQSFDHSHQAFNEVLEQHVVVYDNNLKSAVDYKTLAHNRQQLDRYLITLSDAQKNQYETWSENEQLAFLINAYNGFTLQLIINHFTEFESGKADSIRDLGGLFSTPWEKSFFTLLGKKRTLDWIEHEKIRVDFDEPRIHAALVCAAVSCPKLRAQAFTAGKLDEQLEKQMVAFLSDRDNNGIDAQGIYLSKIFDWYQDDFNSLSSYISEYANALSDTEEQKDKLKQRSLNIRFVDYNWELNSVNNR